MNDKIKHLEFIQNIITRMSSNSFNLKGWGITLISGIFILSNKDNDKSYFIVAYIPIIFFWILDSYYLLQERIYRDLYDMVREEKFRNFELNGNVLKNKKQTLINCMFSKSELLFYIPLATATFVVIFFSK